jgi:cytochrome c5
MIDYVTYKRPTLSYNMVMKLYPILLAGFIATNAMANSHHPQQFLKEIRGKKNEGAQIVAQFCSNCHAQTPLIPIGAPRQGVDAEWQARIAKGWTVLLKNTNEGINAMPPRGGCFECDDEQLILAIKAMLSPKMLQQLHKKSLSDKIN